MNISFLVLVFLQKLFSGVSAAFFENLRPPAKLGFEFDASYHNMAREFYFDSRINKRMVCEVKVFNLIVFDITRLRDTST